MRSILHIDLNNFYASVECLLRPRIKNKPVCVCGDKENRHGVVLAKNRIAKDLGVKTGMVIWEAKKFAPDLITINARFDLYIKYSNKVKEIYSRFTDKIEPYGIDECWLDITQSLKLFGEPIEIANRIKDTILKEVGLTVSVGLSYNKIYAKLGSDIAGINEIVEITKDNREKTIFNLSVEDILYVGKQTKKKLNKINVFTIGDLAKTNKKTLKLLLGKWGEYLYDFANGYDEKPVRNLREQVPFKSIGNSLTNYKDISNEYEIKGLIGVLSESVVYRARELGVRTAKVVRVGIKDSLLIGYSFQGKLLPNILLSSNIENLAFKLIKDNYDFKNKIRALSLSITGLNEEECYQASFLYDYKKFEKLYSVENIVEKIKKKYGNKAIRKGYVLLDKKLENLDLKKEHIIHPESYFK